jgi:hypothetical protein
MHVLRREEIRQYPTSVPGSLRTRKSRHAGLGFGGTPNGAATPWVSSLPLDSVLEEARMTLISTSRPIRQGLIVGGLALAFACTVGPCGVANASPVFDVDGYSACTATTAPAPDQDFDAVVTGCCVQNAGVPAPTRFGMGCVAPMDGAATDERPTIVLPMRPAPPEDADGGLDDLGDLGDLPLPAPIP